MNWQLLVQTSLAIQIHLIVAIMAFFIGAVQLLLKKGTIYHKIIGRFWVAFIVIICLSSFWIKELIPNSYFYGYSPIHLLSIFVLIQTSKGLYYARVGNIKKHKKSMIYTYIGGLFVAGTFTFYPNRLLYNVFIAPWLNS